MAHRWWTSSHRFARSGRRRPCSSHFPDAGRRRRAELEEAPVLPAVNGQRGSGDEARAVAGQEHDRRCPFMGTSMPAKRDVADAPRRELAGIDTERDRLVPVFLDDAIRLKATGEDGIDADF